LPGIATQPICADLLGILKEILAYGIGGLYARHGRVNNVFLHEPFFVDSLNRAVLEENRSIKTVSETFLCHFIGNVNYLAWPDPRPTAPPAPPRLCAMFGCNRWRLFYQISSVYQQTIDKTYRC
jgi:hypothetical protein